MNKLGERIHSLREKAGLSKAALARRVGVSDVTISYWESGTIQRIGHSRLGPLSRALNCSIGYLLGDNKTDPEPPTGSCNTSFQGISIFSLTREPACLNDSHQALGNIPASLLPEAWQEQDGYLLKPDDRMHFDFFHEGDWMFAAPALRFTTPGLYVMEERGQLVIQRLVKEPSGCWAENSRGERTALAVNALPRARVLGVWQPITLY